MDSEDEHALQMFERIIETKNSDQQITLISGKDGQRYLFFFTDILWK